MSKDTGPLTEIVQELGPTFAARAADNDAEDRFVADNYAALKEHKVFSAMVPAELGGGGVEHGEMCDTIRRLAHYCPSTALALSMHQHLIATFRWNFQNGRPGEKPLRAVAEKELVLVSTGAGDWLASRGNATKVDGGFLIWAQKPFGSGSPAGDLLVTSIPYEDPEEGWQVLHCPVPATAEGVIIGQDWQAMGMRGTGSHTVTLKNVFVPEETVVLRRPRGQYHAFWDIVLTVALPLIMSAYTGIAEAAAEIAVQHCRKAGDDGRRPALLGEVLTQLTTAQLAQQGLVANANNLAFTPDVALADAALQRKSIVVNAATTTVMKAIETVGGSAYFRKAGLERLLRDVMAAQFHIMPERKQQEFAGRVAMGLGPAPEMDWITPTATAA